MSKYIKNIGIILVILGHYYFCGYVLSEVHDMKNYEPLVKIINNSSKEGIQVNEKSNSDLANTKHISFNKYLGIIEIPKINLKRYLYDIDSSQNDVDKNIEILKDSDMPNVRGGNLILAGHNGNSAVGHFKNLHKVTLGDKVVINYNNINYTYEISKIYDVLKTGSVAIKRNKNKNTITLITCLGSDKQLVVIGYLKDSF